jgi:hypothetical protein
MSDLKHNTQSILEKLDELEKLLVVDNDKPSFVISKLEEDEGINKPATSLNDSYPSQVPKTLILRSPAREFILHGNKCSLEEMHNALVFEEEATVTIYYEDGKSHQLVWHCKNYSQKSNLTSNLGSGFLRGWREKGVIKIRVKVE